MAKVSVAVPVNKHEERFLNTCWEATGSKPSPCRTDCRWVVGSVV